MRIRRCFAAVLLFCAVLAASHQSIAHAIIIESAPAVDAGVTGPDVPISLRFNSRIDQERSRLTLTGPGGKNLPLTMAPASGPDTLSAKASGLTPGAYTLRWQVLAVDGHITRGDIPFRLV